MINNFVKNIGAVSVSFCVIKQIKNQSITITFQQRYFENLTPGSSEYSLLKKYQIRNNIYHTHSTRLFGSCKPCENWEFPFLKTNKFVDHNNPIKKPFRNVQ